MTVYPDHRVRREKKMENKNHIMTQAVLSKKESATQIPVCYFFLDLILSHATLLVLLSLQVFGFLSIGFGFGYMQPCSLEYLFQYPPSITT
jgi:hypothetical protein